MKEDKTDLAVRGETEAAHWTGAASRGRVAREERQRIIAELLIEDVDYGIIPGTQKPTLYKSGAERIVDALELATTYEEVRTVEDWDRPFFFYRYRAVLCPRGTDFAIASGIGSCNSREKKYAYRKAVLTCPACSSDAVIRGRKEYGGGFVCWRNKGGCGAKFPDDDPEIAAQPQGDVPNTEVCDLVNTIDKMAQKRSKVAAVLDLGFSDKFSQDHEDDEGARGTPEEQPRQRPRRASEANGKKKDGPTTTTSTIAVHVQSVDTIREADGEESFEVKCLTASGKTPFAARSSDEGLAALARQFAGTGDIVSLTIQTVPGIRGPRAVSITAADAPE